MFFAIAQIFGAIAPLLYGVLIGNGTNRTGLTISYLIGGGIMIIGGLVEVFLGIELLVLAARSGIAKVLGTVSQYVLRNAPCPVLTVPEADIDSPGLEAAQQHSTSPTA